MLESKAWGKSLKLNVYLPPDFVIGKRREGGSVCGRCSSNHAFSAWRHEALELSFASLRRHQR